MSTYSTIQRQKDLLVYFFLKYQPKCCFCKELLTPDSLFPKKSGKKMDDYTKHHLDCNHYNDDPSNWELAHRTCHRKYHMNRR